MLDFLKRLFGRTAKTEQVVEAPYKVEAPESGPKKCGCGRSQSGNCVGLHALTPEEWSTHESNPNKAVPAKKTAKVKKVATAKKTTTAKVAAKPRKTTKKSI